MSLIGHTCSEMSQSQCTQVCFWLCQTQRITFCLQLHTHHMSDVSTVCSCTKVSSLKPWYTIPVYSSNEVMWQQHTSCAQITPPCTRWEQPKWALGPSKWPHHAWILRHVLSPGPGPEVLGFHCCFHHDWPVHRQDPFSTGKPGQSGLHVCTHAACKPAV